ncbi:MAG: hypothetical protein IJ374_06695 [Lachnospiraceae bacterium]|nr:hypothetical protein [Lachnospiraceae bacterium]
MKKFRLLFATVMMCFLMGLSSFAGTWKSDAVGWWYENDDGSYYVSCWQWIDGNNDGIAECYYFDPSGYCLMNTVTPDGCTVDVNGAWTVDGVVQTKAAEVVLVEQAVASEAVTIIQQEVEVAEESSREVTETTYSNSGISHEPYSGYTIVVNTNTGKYHVPGCKSVNQMKEKNKGYCSDVNYLLSNGYEPCKNCH